MSAPSFSRNLVLLSGGQIAGRLVLFGTTIYLTRVLSAENFGITAFATSVLAWAALIVDFGLMQYAPLEVARQSVPIRMLVRNVIGIRLLLTVAGFGALLLFVGLAPLTSVTVLVLLIYGISLVTTAADLDWLFLGAQLMHVSAAGEIIHQVTMLAGVILFVHRPEDVILVPVVYLVSRLASTAFLIVMAFRRFGWMLPGIDLKFARMILRASAPLAGTAGLAMVSHNFDLIYIGLVLGSASAGLYAAAYRIVWVPTLLVTSYYLVLRPIVAKASTSGIGTIDDLMGNSTRIAMGLVPGVVAGGVLLAEPVVTLLFGDEYAASAQPLKLLFVALGMLAISRNYRLILVCFNRQGTDFWIMSVAAAINIGLNVALIPRYGLSGAALATVASELFILVACYTASRMLIGHVPLGRYLLRPAVALGAMLGVFFLSGGLLLPIRVLLAAASYIVLLIVMRVITVKDVRWFIDSISPRRSQPTPEGGR